MLNLYTNEGIAMAIKQVYYSKKTKFGNIGRSKDSQGHADFQARLMDEGRCRNCKNCWGCFDCVNCVNCRDCESCVDCKGLSNKEGDRSLIFADIAKREMKLSEIVEDYFSLTVPVGYNLPSQLKEAGIIPSRYIVIRLGNSRVFKDVFGKPLDAIEATILGLVKTGCLQQVEQAEIPSEINFRGRCYKVMKDPRQWLTAG